MDTQPILHTNTGLLFHIKRLTKLLTFHQWQLVGATTLIFLFAGGIYFLFFSPSKTTKFGQPNTVIDQKQNAKIILQNIPSSQSSSESATADSTSSSKQNSIVNLTNGILIGSPNNTQIATKSSQAFAPGGNISQTTTAGKSGTTTQQGQSNPSPQSQQYATGQTNPVNAPPIGTNGSPLVSSTSFLSQLLYFKNAQGQIVPYVPGSVSPSLFSWGVYNNTDDKYSIEYPKNWIVVKNIDNGHEGLSIYPPNADLSASQAQSIGLGWSSNYHLPSIDAATISFQTSITVSGILGQLYTQGSLGANNIAAMFPYRFGYFGIGGSASSDELIYVLDHMLSTLKFIP